jgi:hypothetical protein
MPAHKSQRQGEKKKTSANPGVQRQDWSIDPQALAFEEKRDKKAASSGRDKRALTGRVTVQQKKQQPNGGS